MCESDHTTPTRARTHTKKKKKIGSPKKIVENFEKLQFEKSRSLKISKTRTLDHERLDEAPEEMKEKKKQKKKK